VDIIIYILVKTAISKLKTKLLKKNMEFITPSIKDYIQLAVITAKLYATAIYFVFFKQNPAKFVIIIRNIASCVISFIYHIPRIIPDLVHIADGIYYYI